MDAKTTNLTDVVFFTFKQMIGDNGTLIAMENEKDIPMTIKRIFYVFNSPKEELRGKHAHKKVNQILICLSGKCTVFVDDSKKIKSFVLDSPEKALFIPNGIWASQEYNKETILLVLCDGEYSEDEYIRSYEEFKKTKS